MAEAWFATTLPLGMMENPAINDRPVIPARKFKTVTAAMAPRDEPGVSVTLSGIRSRPDLNGVTGKVRDANLDLDGFMAVTVPGRSQAIRVKPRCLSTDFVKDSLDAPATCGSWPSRLGQTLFSSSISAASLDVDSLSVATGGSRKSLQKRSASTGSLLQQRPKTGRQSHIEAVFGKHPTVSDVCNDNLLENSFCRAWPQVQPLGPLVKTLPQPTDLKIGPTGVWKVAKKSGAASGWAGYH
eukprot:TRINITY_DN125414_c0_g1_i1.p1 TRINITY_DN125414_c0_g1~~TRINITY_DN125414_c0_g1_i1.p1  ORF type:complete len:241 (-),score=34.71 TRINITY_DN125414_c0_g1_i1:208-930(-)